MKSSITQATPSSMIVKCEILPLKTNNNKHMKHDYRNENSNS
jgi:hypothetical protein